MADPERYQASPERSAELQEAAEKQSEKLGRNLEKAGEHFDDSEARTSAERKKVEALFEKERPAGEHKAGGEPSGPAPIRPISKKQKEAAYEETMTHVRAEMSPSERIISKVIHNPAVEKTSEVVGTTVARPNAILAGSLTAFILVAVVYFVARTMGYELSGFETIGAFIVGWVLGILFDFLRIMITGKRTA